MAARGEYESFQVVVHGGGGAPVIVTDVSVSDLHGPGDSIISRDDITLYREHYIEVKRGTPDWGGSNRPLGAGRYADALVPFVHPDTGAPLNGAIRARGMTVEPGANQPYWVDVLVPTTAAAGTYTGQYVVTTDRAVFAGPVTLTVLDFTLPVVPSLYTAFLNSSQRESINQELLRHKLMPAVPIDSLGPLLSDDRLNAVSTGFYSGADRDSCRMAPPPPVAEIAAVAARRPPQALIYNYTADEISECEGLTARLQEWARNLHEAGVRQLVTMPPDPALFTDGRGGAGIDIWAVLPKDFDAGTIEQMYQASAEMQLWSYTAVAQDNYSPKWLIDFSPTNFRILPGFLNQAMGVTGTLYWRVDNWHGEPWETAVMYDGTYPGDGMLVYPGEQVGMPGGAAPSIRLKWIRDGVEDYAYAEFTRAVGATAETTRIIRSVAQDWHTWSADPDELLRARLELASVVLRARASR
ncbi:MAG: DUF4091 domain-containing protein [Actinomycetia bacterium]|nr:DUF4091 domain-containing protein [Actinomycetes bacterium]